jgi:hypothetical protein
MKNFQELVRHICERPEMYVGERRFITVSAWLNGYSSALVETKNTGEVVGLDGFTQWLSQKFHESHGLERNLVWWFYLVRLYPNDEEALKQLPVLIDEFIRERSKVAELRPADGYDP